MGGRHGRSVADDTRKLFNQLLNNMTQIPCTPSATAGAAERFFRLYKKHCISPDLDTLFNLLNSIHSLNEKLKKELSADFFSVKEFVALKAIRNFFHHQNELLHEVKVIPAENLPLISTDLAFLCLVPQSLVEKAISGIEAKRKERDEATIRKTLKWYGNVVNINPCIFNFAVHVYEKTKSLGIQLSSDAYLAFQESYEFEESEGYSHFITGDISCHAGTVDEVLSIAFADIV